jgi:alcohol dehydrogenase YqhD (iron-dependent ADH family)
LLEEQHWLHFFLNKDSCQTKLVFSCPILELKLIGLESVDVVLVNIETEQVKMRAASNLVAIHFAILNPN